MALGKDATLGKGAMLGKDTNRTLDLVHVHLIHASDYHIWNTSAALDDNDDNGGCTDVVG